VIELHLADANRTPISIEVRGISDFLAAPLQGTMLSTAGHGVITVIEDYATVKEMVAAARLTPQ
jgi:hypothetical protein